MSAVMVGLFLGAYDVPCHRTAPNVDCRAYSKDLGKFLDYALEHPNTWVVTISQFLDWMEAPVPAGEVSLVPARLLLTEPACGTHILPHFSTSP